jgi:hypothetical protein
MRGAVSVRGAVGMRARAVTRRRRSNAAQHRRVGRDVRGMRIAWALGEELAVLE